MNTIRVLDVTLRDGGHRTDFHFEDTHIKQIISALDKAGIDFIEVGYKNGLNCAKNTHKGKCCICNKDYLTFCRNLMSNSQMAVMAYPKNINEQDLKELKESGVGLLRICITPEVIHNAKKLFDMCHDLDLNLGINITSMSKYTMPEIDLLVKLASSYAPMVIYFADSNGSMHPAQIQKIYQRYTNHYKIPFGFHAHDNLGLAQANAIAALQAGVKFIDCSLSGLGKGIGNLRAEFFIAYLNALKIDKYSLQDLLPSANLVRKHFRTENDMIDLDEFHRGISNL